MYARVYEAIRQCHQRYGMAPSQGELMRAVGCSSTTVHNAMRILRNKGHITAQKFAVRGAKPTDMDRTVLSAPLDPYADLDTPIEYWQ